MPLPRALILAALAALATATAAAQVSVTYYEHGTARTLSPSLPSGTLQSNTFTVATNNAENFAWNFTSDAVGGDGLVVAAAPVTFKGTLRRAGNGGTLYANWQLVQRYSNGTEAEICRTPQGTSGQVLTASDQNLTASCTPAANHTLLNTSQLRVKIFIYRSGGSSLTATHSWDTATADSNVNLAQDNVSTALSYAFTVTLPGKGPASSNGSTASIEFNATGGTQNQVNASVVGTAANQTATVPIFNYTNTGTATLNITIAFGTSLPSGVTVKAANAAGGYQSTCSGTVSTTTCAAISTSPAIVAFNLAVGASQPAWLWADFLNAAAQSVSRTLTHTSGA